MQYYRLVLDDQSTMLSCHATELFEVLKKIAEGHGYQSLEIWSDGKLLGQLEIEASEDGAMWRLT